MSSFHDKEHPYIQQVLKRTEWDRDFRERLKLDPKAAIKEETGIDVPAGFDIRFLERPGRSDLMAMFPEPPPEEEDQEEEDELSLDDLEEAAGGRGGHGGHGDDPPPKDPESPW